MKNFGINKRDIVAMLCLFVGLVVGVMMGLQLGATTFAGAVPTAPPATASAETLSGS